MAKKSLPTVEAKMQALENLIDQMESGELPLEEAIVAFENGSLLIKEIQKILEEAEQKILVLTQKNSLEDTFEAIGDHENF